MKKTEKMGLWLPEDTDPLEVSKLSENFERLDPVGGGIEAVRDGMGVGSLLMVSKHYQEPIKNALLCNGGSADPAAYPELFDLLGTSYGAGALAYTTLNTQYGITAAYGYPAAYNAERDMYIAKASDHLVLYQKNQPPQEVALPAGYTGYTSLKVCSFGDGIYIAATVSSETKYQAYDLAARTWKTPLSSAKAHYKIPQFGFNRNGLVRVGDYLFLRNSGRIYWVEIGEADPAIHDFAVATGNFFPILNLDYAETDRVYFYLNNTIVYAEMDEIINFPSLVTAANFKTVATLSSLSITNSSAATYVNATTNHQMIIFNNHLYQAQSGFYLVGCDLAAPSSGMKKMVTLPTGGSRFGDTFAFAAPLPGGSLLVVFDASYSANPHTTAYILTGLSASAASNSRVTNMDTQYIGGPVFLTTAGVLSDMRIGSFKLPSITMSEALVYIRARAADVTQS